MAQNEAELSALMQDHRSMGTRDELRAILEQMSQADPDDRVVTLYLAIELAAAGNPTRAIELLLPLAQDRNFAGCLQAMLELGHIYLADAMEDKARAYYQQARDAFPDNHWPVLDLCKLSERAGRVQESLGILSQGMQAGTAAGRAILAQRAAAIVVRDLFPTARNSDYWGLKKISMSDALTHSCLMIMVKDEEDIIGANLMHHYVLGFRVFCIVNNLSSDGTERIIAQFRDEHPEAFVFSATDPIRGYYQAEKMAAFLDFFPKYLRVESRIEWMFFVDADEFICFLGRPGDETRLRDVLSSPEKLLLVFHWINCASPEPFLDARPRDPLDAFPLMQGHIGDAASKIALRVGRGLYPTQGNHFVEMLPGSLEAIEVLAASGWYMLHYPLRSIPQVRRKVINGGRAYEGTGGLENHGGHWKRQYDRYKREGELAIDDMLRTHIEQIRQTVN